MQSSLEKLTEDWNGIDTVVLYGLGLVAERFIDKIFGDFAIPYIIDKKKAGTKYRNIPVVTIDEAVQHLTEKKEKIVVLTSQRVYDDIKRTLEEKGLAEYRDFCRVEQFVVEWYKVNKGHLNIVQLNTAVTTWCTLNCEKCNMFMPYYANTARQHYSFTEMKADLDAIFDFADYIFTYMFLGGEPFLNRELKDIISYAGQNYGNRIGKIGITTNGTIVPDVETLEQIRKYNVIVYISDYTDTVKYMDKMEKFIQTLEHWNIMYVRNRMTEWRDFGFPVNPFHWGADQVAQHMRSCAPLFHGINEQKIYYCHIIWSAEKAGLYTVPKQDYIDLKELDPKDPDNRMKVIRYCEGECERGFLGLCMLCGGCGEDNDRIIRAGEQRKISRTHF